VFVCFVCKNTLLLSASATTGSGRRVGRAFARLLEVVGCSESMLVNTVP
jgi:hypothetical protein